MIRFFAMLLLALLLAACQFPIHPQAAPATGTFEVILDYTGTWYREVFHYARDAGNIWHYVLVLPESEVDRATPDWIFTSFVPGPDGLTVRDDRQEYAWALEYTYYAPMGLFMGDFPPGRYAISAAVLAGPLNREDAGVGPDAVAWPGITGGGLSTGYQMIEIKAGHTLRMAIELTDADGWACPWLYVFDGQTFERRTEILRNVRGAEQKQTEITTLDPVTVVDGAVVLKITEEKAEITTLDALALSVGGVTVLAEGYPALGAEDGDVLVLEPGESVILRFLIPAGVQGGPVSVIATGYYE